MLLLVVGAATPVLAAFRGGIRHASEGTGRYHATAVAGDAFPKTLIDGKARTPLPKPPSRIASLTVTADEVVTALVDETRIAAVTHFVDDPTIVTCAGRAPKNAARVRGAEPERVLSLGPDLVFVAHYTLDSATRLLGAASVPVVRLGETRSFDDVAANVRTIGAATGSEAAAAELLRAMQRRLDHVREAVASAPRPRVLYYSAVGYTSGANTLVDAKIRAAGGTNVAAEAGLSGFRNVALDVLVALDPEVIIVPHWTPDASAPVRDVTEAPAWRDVTAVRTHRVYALPASDLTSESPDGAAGVEALARRLHPGVVP